MITNRGEAVCLDIEGQANGNDGPYQDEGRHMTANGRTSLVARGSTLVPRDANDDERYDSDVTTLDADIIWLFDIPRQAGTWPHDSAHGSILIDGDFLYVNTSNGKDNTHRRIRCPDGPSLICLDKKTGRLVARDYEDIGPRIFHSTWSCPALGVVNGRKLIFFCGGDGVVYAFEPLQDSTCPKGKVEAAETSLAIRLRPDGTKGERQPVHGQPPDRAPATSRARRSSSTTACTSRSAAISGGAKTRRGSSASTRQREGDITSTGLLWSCDSERALSARRPRFTTAWSTSPIAAGRSTALMPRQARSSGRRRPKATSGPRRWSPTARSISARTAGTSGFWPPAGRRRS